MFRGFLSALALAALVLPALQAEADTNYAAIAKGGKWPAAGHTCVDSKVTQVGYRLDGTPGSGSAVSFAANLGVSGIRNARAGIVSYDTIPVAAREHPGDPVQVCLLTIPKADQYCNPKTDSRGREYRVFDYKQGKAYAGANAEHTCGGA
jgi:hypothetical protein